MIDVFPSHLLNANSSKVWTLNYSDNLDADVPSMEAYRTCFIFFENKNFREQELIHLGSSNGSVGKYSIDEDQEGNFILILHYSHEKRKTLRFVIQKLDNTKLVLEKIEDQTSNCRWDLNTLPPPFKN